jgi:hypothetical protein
MCAEGNMLPVHNNFERQLLIHLHRGPQVPPLLGASCPPPWRAEGLSSSCHLIKGAPQLPPPVGAFCSPPGQPDGLPAFYASPQGDFPAFLPLLGAPHPPYGRPMELPSSCRLIQGRPSFHRCWGSLASLLGGHGGCHLLVILSRGPRPFIAARDASPAF